MSDLPPIEADPSLLEPNLRQRLWQKRSSVAFWLWLAGLSCLAVAMVERPSWLVIAAFLSLVVGSGLASSFGPFEDE